MPEATSLEALLDELWAEYLATTPEAKRIHDLLVARGERVVNDHIALRTLDLPGIGVDALARPFVESGYVARGRYEFPEKKLVARHYEPPRPGLPKIFVSELETAKLDPGTRGLLRSLVDTMDPALSARFDTCRIGRPWEVSYATYRRLATASDYAAWVAAFGFRPNHFTVDVNALATFATIAELNEFLERHGFVLNAAGGKVKGSPAALLEQSSVLAGRVAVRFSDGSYLVPGCYYEFARRYPGPDGELYQGFVAASADKLFESTQGGRPAA